MSCEEKGTRYMAASSPYNPPQLHSYHSHPVYIPTENVRVPPDYAIFPETPGLLHNSYGNLNISTSPTNFDPPLSPQFKEKSASLGSLGVIDFGSLPPPDVDFDENSKKEMDILNQNRSAENLLRLGY